MMRNPQYWPRWPILPIKLRQEHGLPRCACLVEWNLENGISNIRFIEANSFMLDAKDIEDAATADITSLIAEGWVVD